MLRCSPPPPRQAARSVHPISMHLPRTHRPKTRGGSPSVCHSCFYSRGLLDGLANTLISSAAADIALHDGFNLTIGRVRRLFQQRHGLHNLPALTVAALWNVIFLPR